ncbi:hypothetical protein GW750_08555 [bacterium]|nr:hypothetical protein [bacterium]
MVRKMDLVRYLGGAETLTSIALRLDSTKERIADPKNDKTDGEVSVTIKGGLLIKKGMTETVEVIVNVAPAYFDAAQTEDQAAGDTFRFGIDTVTADCADVVISDELSNIHVVATKDAPELQIMEDKTVKDVKVGQQSVEIATFTIENKDKEDKDLYLSTFTLENKGSANLDTDASNFELYIEDVLVATDPIANDDRITFLLDDSYKMIDNKKLDMMVKADIIGGVDDSIYLAVEDELDVTAYRNEGGNNYRTYAGVTLEAAAAGEANPATDAKNYIIIEAGELTIVEIDDNVEIRSDKDEETLGTFKMIVNDEVENLKIENVYFTIENLVPFRLNTDGSTSSTARTTKISDLLTNVTLENTTNGSEFDMRVVTTQENSATKVTFKYDSSEEFLNPGENVFRLYTDIDNLTDGEYADFVDSKYKISFSDIGKNLTTAGFIVKEDEDDKLVTDITPSTIELIAEAV